MAPITPLPVRRVAVYELMNTTRLESVLVLTGEDEAAVRRRLNGPLPAPLARWNPLEDNISVQMLSPRLGEDLAEEFVKTYMNNMRHKTWRFRVWRI
jgi:hypothetical protein